MKTVFINGFWSGFAEETDGVHFGFFKNILTSVFETDIHITTNISEADILLESFFQSSAFFAKQWAYSIFFSGEGTISIPNHIHKYSYVMGTLPNRDILQSIGSRYIPCPLYIAYEYSKPAHYATSITTIPPKSICSIISSEASQYRINKRREFVEYLTSQQIPIDFGGSYKNNIGFKVQGQYYEQPILEFQKQYRIVCAFENCCIDDYITEKIINALRANTIPLYLGSDKIGSYINENRIIKVDTNNFSGCLEEIHKLLTDDAYWLKKINEPIFVKPISVIMEEIAIAMKKLL
jgi:hypothetical protein